MYLHDNLMYPGGNAVNVAVYSKMLGTESAYLGIYGKDRAGEYIRSILEQQGIDQSHCRTIEGENGFSAVDLVDGDRTYIGGNAGGVSKLFPLELTSDDLDYISQYDLIHTSCYSYIEPELPKLSSLGPMISFDFSNRFTEDYANQVCPFIDIGLVSCGSMEEEEISEVHRIAKKAGCDMIIASMGSRGAKLFAGDNIYTQEAIPVKVVDTLGAGDGFFTGFIVNYLKALKKNQEDIPEVIKDCLTEAARFAAEVCKWNGAFGFGITIK